MVGDVLIHMRSFKDSTSSRRSKVYHKPNKNVLVTKYAGIVFRPSSLRYSGINSPTEP